MAKTGHVRMPEQVFQLRNMAEYLKDPEVSWLQHLDKHVLGT